MGKIEKKTCAVGHSTKIEVQSRRSMPPTRQDHTVASSVAGSTHLDGDAWHDLQRERYLEWLVMVALVDVAQRLRLRQTESTDAPRAQQRRSILHIRRRPLLVGCPDPSRSPPPTPRLYGRVLYSRAISPIRGTSPPDAYRSLARRWLLRLARSLACSLTRSTTPSVGKRPVAHSLSPENGAYAATALRCNGGRTRNRLATRRTKDAGPLG